MSQPDTKAMEDPLTTAWRERLDDREWLRLAVGSQGVREIAAEIGCGPSTVHRAIRRHAIDVRAEQRSVKAAAFVGRRFGMLAVREETSPAARSGNCRVWAACEALAALKGES